MPNGLDKLTEGLGKAIETVPELYKDAFQPAVQETGKFIARIPHAINAAFSGLDKWILNKEYSIDETKKLLAQKLENIEPEKIVEPEPYVAIPALQAISYSMNSDELRNLYANLLAKSMNADTKDSVHPSFVEIIKQLSPVDSLVFKKIMERETNPLVNLIYEDEEGSFITLATNVSDIPLFAPEVVSISVDNLVKQSLIHIPADEYYINNKIYEPILNSNYYRLQQELHSSTTNGYKFTHQKRKIDKTNLGRLFYKICVVDL